MNPLVWVVDDDHSVLRAVERLLRAAGFAVQTFSAADDVPRAEQSVRPCCLVLDVRLDGKSGFDLYGELREAGVSTPVVFMTAYDEPGTRERMRRAGAVQYLTKPFDELALIEALRRATAVGQPAGAP